MAIANTINKRFCFLFFLAAVSISRTSCSPPNIVFILTDDQDAELGGKIPMVKAQKLLGDNGLTFSNMFVSSPLCCPSRFSILTGKYVHNHGASNNSLEGNCSSPDWQRTQEPQAFPALLRQGGYRTFFAGKYLNTYGFEETGGVRHIPPGWDVWNGLVGNSVYYNYVLSVNGIAESHGENYSDDYLTDVIHRRGIEFLNNQTPEGAPFFMMLSTPACHDPFTPAPQYSNDFANLKAPRNGSFNVYGKDKHWLIRQAINPLPSDTITFIDNAFRNRWRTLLSVDDIVEDVVDVLDNKGLLNNTYIFFTSDNGFHMGQFSLSFDKRQLYEFDIRVPMIVRGPGVPRGKYVKDNVMNIDLAPTFLELAGLGVPPAMDGLSFTPLLRGQPRLPHPVILIEHSGEGSQNVEGCPQYWNQYLEICDLHCVCEDTFNNTYACVRYEDREGLAYKLCRFQDHENFLEVYNLTADHYELTNIAQSAPSDLINELSVWLQKLSTCAGDTCKYLPSLLSDH